MEVPGARNVTCGFAVEIVPTVHSQISSGYTAIVKRACMRELYRSH